MRGWCGLEDGEIRGYGGFWWRGGSDACGFVYGTAITGEINLLSLFRSSNPMMSFRYVSRDYKTLWLWWRG